MLSLLAACLLLLPVQVTGVTPAEGSIGTTLVLDGSGFGAKKPTVRLVDPGTGKKLKLKVLAWSETQLTARLGKGAPAGPRGIRLHPKLKGAVDLVAPGAFTLRAPLPLSVEPLLVEPQQATGVQGAFFGTKPGKVFVGGKQAKLTAWADDLITIVVPKQAPGGVVDVMVVNTIGSTTATAALAVLSGGTLGGPDLVSLTVDGVAHSASGTPAVLALQAAGTFRFGAAFGPGLMAQVDLPIDVTTVPLPITIANDVHGGLAWREGTPLVDASPDTWNTKGPGSSYQVVLMERLANRIIGRFEGLLAHAQGGSGLGTRSVVSSLFVITVP